MKDIYIPAKLYAQIKSQLQIWIFLPSAKLITVIWIAEYIYFILICLTGKYKRQKPIGALPTRKK